MKANAVYKATPSGITDNKSLSHSVINPPPSTNHKHPLPLTNYKHGLSDGNHRRGQIGFKEITVLEHEHTAGHMEIEAKTRFHTKEVDFPHLATSSSHHTSRHLPPLSFGYAIDE